MKTKEKQSEAITLIALVITIIILLILAGISIATLSNTGLFEKTKKSKTEYEKSEIQEELQLAVLAIQSGNINQDNIKTIIKELPEQKNLDLSKLEWDKNQENEEPNGTYKGYNFYINKNCEVKIGEKEKSKKIEKYIKFKGGTQIDSGISQNELMTNNEYKFTIATKIKINRNEQQTINYMDIIGGHLDSNGLVWEFLGTSTNLVCYTGGETIIFDYSPYYDKWIDIVETYTNEQFNIYINGELIDTKSNCNFVPYNKIYIGNSYQLENRCMKGCIESVRIWKTVLSADEIKNIDYFVENNNIRKDEILKEMTFESKEIIEKYGTIYGNGYEILDLNY